MWKARLLNISLVVIIGLNLLTGYRLVLLRQLGKLEIYMLDVGQGDSILIHTPDGGYGLVDGGRGAAVLSQLAEVLPIGDRKLDFVLATHPDADHIEGLISVVQNYKVQKIFITKNFTNSGVYAELKSSIAQSGIENFEIKDTNDFKLGCCTNFDILWPRETMDGYHESETNRLSTAVLLSYRNFRMFLAGDLPAAEELDSIQNLENRDIAVLKVGHHGSRTSTSSRFLDETKPELVLISDGINNSYGHPHAEVLQNLLEHNVKIFRTDQIGRISLDTDGEELEIKGQKELEYFHLKL
jgi:competence protein ComEC